MIDIDFHEFKLSPIQKKVIDSIERGESRVVIQKARGTFRPYFLKVIAKGKKPFEFSYQTTLPLLIKLSSVDLATGKECRLWIADSTDKSRKGRVYHFKPYTRRYVGNELRIYAKTLDK